MDNAYFSEVARKLVYEYTLAHLDKSDEFTFSLEDVFIVWSCKTLQNNKAMLSTKLFDGMYYEVTYNGNQREFYLDAYKKFQNLKFVRGDLVNV